MAEKKYIDPLDDNLPDMLENFPKKPLTSKDINLCDHSRHTLFDGGYYTCEGDKSCRKCRVSPMERYLNITNSLMKPSRTAQRKLQVFNKFGPPAPGNIVFISTLNSGQLYLFLNWVCSLEKIHIDATGLILMVPTDRKTHDYLVRLGFLVVSIDWLADLQKPIGKGYKSDKANIGGHSDINNVGWILANEVLQSGYDIVLQDVDAIWKSDIRPFLRSAGLRRDLLGSGCRFTDKAKYPINTGFLYFRNSFKSKVFFQTLVNVGELKLTSDQQLFNMVLLFHRFSDLEFRVLPYKFFYTFYGRSNPPQPTEHLKMFHIPGPFKRSKMAHYGFWLFDETCNVFDPVVNATMPIV